MSRLADLFKYLTRCCGAAATVAVLVALAGCSRGPDRVEAPAWDPSGLADNILAELDKNADAQIDAEELVASPGLAVGVKNIDADGDKQLSREELEARFERYRALRVGLRSPSFHVTYRGRPVGGATLDFIPELWLEGIIEAAQGTTDASGYASPQAAGQNLPGMRIGYYRVKVTSPQTKVPEKYAGDATPLGADVSLGDAEASYGPIELKLFD